MLESLIRAVLERDGKEGGESTVVALHCQQMREWGIRGGNIEHRPIQDMTGDRFKLITKLRKHNQLQQRFDHIMDCLVCRGEVLWYFVPDVENPGLYRIEFFTGGQNHPDPQFRVFYKPGGREFEKIIIRYSYDDTAPGTYLKQQRWVRITITQDWIEQSESLNKPQFDEYGALGIGHWALPTQTRYFENTGFGATRYENPFKPYFPVALSKNNGRQLGQQGSDDFYWIQSLIEMHEGLVIKAHKNLRMFANPILVTTRSAQEVMNQVNQSANTWASANRYYDMTGTPYSGSTNPADVSQWGMQRTPGGMFSTNSSEGQLDTIFGNVGDGERFAFIQADAVSGDQNLWIRQERELIHWILGGIDPLAGISAGSTFGEIKTLFGRVQNTADKRAEALFGSNGLSTVYERIIWREEQLFKNWLFDTLTAIYPQQFTGLTSPEQLTDEICQDIWALRREGVINLPKNPVGMLPTGDREVIWRYTREVFQNTTREELDRSIAARNEREDGLSQEWVLRKQYPNMTDQEIKNAMSGFSPRVVQNAAVGIQTTLQLFQQFMQIPDPEDPKRPWAIRLGLPRLLEQSMLTLQREMAYGIPTYEPAEEDIKPTLENILLQLNGERTGGTPHELLPLLSGDITASDTAADAVLQSMGLPTAAAIAERLYRSGYQNPELRGSFATTGQSTTTGYPGAANSVFNQQLPNPANPGNWGAGTTLGSVGESSAAGGFPSAGDWRTRAGDIDPAVLALYANILAAQQQPRG